MPSFLGVFIDSLASYIDELTLMMHETQEHDGGCDYLLTESNIRVVSLGIKTASWHRVIFHKAILKSKIDAIPEDSIFLIRTPTPLAPYFSRYFARNKIVYLVVGDYLEAVKNSRRSNFRQILINYLLRYNSYLFERTIKSKRILVNSVALFDKYKGLTDDIFQVKTTTLKSSDFGNMRDTCIGEVVRLVYTGRIDLQKGLIELIEATSILVESGLLVECHLAGWEDDTREPVKVTLLQLVRNKGLDGKVIFHGRKKVGRELNEIYRKGDIYIMPSYHEGFPRTIWEAMANSLPVIATRVGAIPKFLTHKKSAYIIDPYSVEDIVVAVKELSKNEILRRTMIEEGRALAEKNTLEIQTKILVEYVAIDKV